jgi:hypothetical protein
VKRSCLLQRARVDPSLRQLVGMAREPPLEALRACFQVELQREDVWPHGEGLIRVEVRLAQTFRACRQVERITVPVQDGLRVRDDFQRRPAASFRQENRRKTDLFCVAGIHPCTAGPSDQLCAQADAKRRLSGGDPIFEKLELLGNEGKPVFLIRTHWAAEHDQQRRAHWIERPKLVLSGVVVVDLVPSAEERLLEGA